MGPTRQHHRTLCVEARDGIPAQVAKANDLLAKLEVLQRDVAEQRNAQQATHAALISKADVQDVNKALADVSA